MGVHKVQGGWSKVDALGNRRKPFSRTDAEPEAELEVRLKLNMKHETKMGLNAIKLREFVID